VNVKAKNKKVPKKVAPILVFLEQVLENMDTWMLGWETHEIHKTASILAYQEEFEWSMSFVSEKIVDMEGIRLKELPSWFIFLSLAFGKITGSSLLPETLFF